jgi:signal transduction histidine kinase/ligand-binding sensor domain-containing protein
MWAKMWEEIRCRRHIRVLDLLLACILLACCPSAFALNPSLDVSQYAHTSWKIRDGFTKGAINAIAQTPDGYLWLGTDFGLLRFDGVRNSPWQSPQDQQLSSGKIWSLLAARDGTLWIGTANRLLSWKDGKLTEYPQMAGQNVFRLLEDREGTVWAGGASVPTGRLCAIQNGKVKCYGEDGILGRGVVGLFEDTKGILWVGVLTGLWRWKPGPAKFYPLAGEPNGIRALGEDEDGSLLIGRNDRLHRFVDGKTEVYQLPDTLGQFSPKTLLRDRDGGLWIGAQYRGIVHIHQGRTDVFVPTDGLSGENVYSIFEDREGNIWVATVNGLDRFHEFAVTTFNVNKGLSNASVGSVLATRDGSVWLGTLGGLNKWNKMSGVREIVASGLPKKGLRSLFQDHRGRVWVSTVRDVGYLENDRLIPIKGIPGGTILAIDEDKAGGIWIINEELGLFHLLPNGEIQQIPWAALGHKDHVSTFAPDPVQTGLWLGFHLGGIAYLAEGQIRTSYTTAEGLAPGRVNQLLFDQSGALLATTDSGLSRLKNGHFAKLDTDNGLPCDAVHSVIEDETHSLWLNTACGIVHIAQPEWDGWAAAVEKDEHARPTIRVTAFDASDGARIDSGGSHYSPQVTRCIDGKLWFEGPDGVQVIDPGHLPYNRLPPPVHVNQITVDRQTYDVSSDSTQRLHLPPLIRDLQIDYTALSLVAPEKVRFRYKLEGYDRDWHEADIRRQAFYTNLPPRNYRFRVMACNNNGVWNETGTYFDFTIEPAYYQTIWFRVAGLIVFLLLIGVIYQLRLQQVARQVRGRMEERLEERERIARDLHDTLLQSVQGLILKFHAVLKQIPSDTPAHNALERTLDHADEVLAEGRARIQNLRVNPVSLSDLPAAFRSIAEEASQGRETIFKTVVEGHVRNLHPLVLEECYSIGREAIINALTHSEGQHVELELTYDSRQFRLRVRDNGQGIDPKILEEGGRPGHWGLQGMRERAQKIGGQLRFWSRPETGTEVELIVPGATAYQSSSQKKFWLSRFERLGIGIEKTED